RRADRLASGMRSGDLSPETVALLQRVDRLLREEAALKVTDLAVNGDDVTAAFGRSPGPYVGEVLRQLLDEVTEEPALNERSRLLARLAELSKVW
ncbi:MAG TPA: polynucleotide adenylyltransferase, partial [Symbiobacteriaceae bacterium]|nr:polynucleotide adenylyltransferase [Symbiobacteriaceae bacterium]